MSPERNLTPQKARSYIEDAAKKLLGVSSEEEFWKLLQDRGRSFISSIPPEEKEVIYRAVANRLYYSFFQFFYWYKWEGEEESGGNQETRARRKIKHHSLQTKVKEKMPLTLLKIFKGNFDRERVKRDISRWIDNLYNYRKHADYRTEKEFRDEDFQDLLESYYYLRLAMVWL